MNPNDGIEHLHWNGVSQKDRLLKALLPEHVKVDERSLSDLLAFAAEYGKLLKFYELDNSPNGDWSRFIKSDITVFLASIIATDLSKIEKEHKQLITRLSNVPRPEEKLEVLEGLFNQVLAMARQVNDWYVHSLNMNRLKVEESFELENELENAIKQQLASKLVEILDLQEDLGFNESGTFSREDITEHFHKNWFKKHELAGASEIKIFDKKVEDKIKDYTKTIRIHFRTFYSVTAYVLQIAPKFQMQSLTDKDDHRPDIGLFISFLELFKQLQDQMNGITEKHLDFYYYNVLKLKERGLRPDKVNVFFDIAKHVDTHLLPKGTLLSAGRDLKGIEHFYATDEDLLLNQAKIEELKTVFISKNDKIGVGSSYQLITNLYKADKANSKDGRGGRFINDEENWPTFGHELMELPKDEQQMQYAEIGWAVAAPVLQMEEGHRIVTMRINFTKSSMYTLNLLIKDLSKNLEISKEDAFTQVFKESLDVFVTAKNGWIKAHACEVLPPRNWDLSEITIVVSIPASAPEIVGYHESDATGNYDTDFPVLKVVQNNHARVFTYSFLKELELERITIDVDVKGIKRLTLSNNLGGIDASVPFQLFGAIPTQGSYLMIGKEELFKKNITDLQLNINWHNLPKDKRGLRGFYEEYELGIKNDAFKVGLTALSNSAFYPTEEEAPLIFDLFEKDSENIEMLNKRTAISNIEIDALNLKPNLSFQMPAVYSNEAQAGFFKLELLGPEIAFGHEVYANIYAKNMAFNSNPNRKGKEKAIPNQPYTPMVRNLTLDYTASSEVHILGASTANGTVVEQVYHIHPFGEQKTYDKGRAIQRNFVPNYDDDAYLYIGLKDLIPPSSLSFYFELKENMNLFTNEAAEISKPEIFWSYLVDDEWKAFSQNQMLADTTNGFNNSGIVNIEIPRDLTANNDSVKDGLHWIRVTLNGDVNLMPRTLKVATQSVAATWIPNEASDAHLKEPLEANKVVRLASSIAQVRGVRQPFPSFGGRIGETKELFYTRVSERLRHKNRAVSAWDFERLVLDHFPDIHQVKCITHVGNEAFVEAGSVILTVIPKIDKNAKGYQLPMVNYTKLEDIRSYLQPLASPFVNIIVRNPTYERVKITAGVTFGKGKNNGTYLKKLNQDLIEFMCPWILGKESELQFGGIFAKDVLLSFMEKRDYVQYITKFSAVQVFPEDKVGFDVEDTALDTSNSPIVKATRPWSILIPFEHNPLYFIDEENFQLPDKASIDTMVIDGDFVMTKEKEEDFDYGKQKRRKKDK